MTRSELLSTLVFKPCPSGETLFYLESFPEITMMGPNLVVGKPVKMHELESIANELIDKLIILRDRIGTFGPEEPYSPDPFNI